VSTMVLESTIICVDNSEFMRNGDFLPTRLQAQQDAVGMITQSKLRSNPESNVGLLTLGGLEVLTTLTTDSGKILAKLTGVQPKGDLNLIPGIKIAHLALKHRLGKNHKMRIVAFVGSPVGADEKDLVKLAKKLKKEKVNVDVISFGEVELNQDVLTKFIETVNGRDGSGSNLVAIPPGPHLSDALVSSPILASEDGAGGMAAGGGGGGQGFEFGVDPNEDPELALALRVSMEEQRARQEAQSGGAAAAPASDAAGAATAAPASAAAAAGGGGEAAGTGGSGATGDDDELQRALEMSMAVDSDDTPAAAASATSAAEPDLSAMTEEEQIAYAMRMSMQDSAGSSSGGGGASGSNDDKMEVDQEAAKDKKGDEDYEEALNDPAVLQSVLESLPGVDPQSDAVRQVVGAMTQSDKKDKKEDKDKDKDKK